MILAVYQIDRERDNGGLKFRSYDAFKEKEMEKPDAEMYGKVFDDELDCSNLESVYTRLNTERPAGFTGHSLSVSDIIEVKEKVGETEPGFYFCDSFGFEKVELDADKAHESPVQNKMRVVLLEPGKLSRVVDIDSSLEGMQAVVGGDIEPYYGIETEKDVVCIICDEEGKIKGYPLNRAVYDEDKEMIEIIAGTAFICDCSGEHFGSLTEEQQIRYAKQFKYNGVLDKFYVNDTHEAIIGKEDFRTAQEILAGRINTTEQTQNKYLFSRRIICAECGWAYRRKVQNGKVYWVCSRKGVSGFVCGGQNYSEDSIYLAFVRMYNKLRRFEKEILDTAISQLADLRNKLTAGNSEIKSIDIEISKLCEQNNQYEKYHLKKIMDDISYMEQTGRLKKRITELRNRRLKLLNENEDERVIENLRVLKKTLQEYPMAIVTFDSELFDAIVEKIKAGNNGTLTFILKGGLCLKERIE